MDDLQTLLSSYNLLKHFETIRSWVRPAIDVVPCSAESLSRFGGIADLPVGFKWPSHPDGVYHFLGQIDLASLPVTETKLPTSGLLSMFFAYDEEGEVFWRDKGYVLAYHFPAGKPLQPTPPPHEPLSSGFLNVSFRATTDLPYDKEQVPEWPLDDEEQGRIRELRETLHVSEAYLFGYPSHHSLGYDPTPEGGWVSLLTLPSYDQLNWCWHDGDKLMVFIRPEDLAAGNFSDLKSDAG